MKWIMARASFLATFLAACQHSTPVEQPPPVAQVGEAQEQTDRVYVEAVMLLVPREELKNLPPVVSELAARTDGTVVSAPHVLLEAGHPSVFEAPADSDATTSFTWKLNGGVLADGAVQLGVGVTRNEPDEEASTTLVLSSGQIAILPTLFSAPRERILVLVLQPTVIRSAKDLKRMLDEKRELAESARRGESLQ